MRTIPFVLFALFSCAANAQQPGLDWAQRSTCGAADRGYDIVVDASENSYITGIFSDTIDLDPGPQQALHITSAGVEIYVVKYDGQGNHVWSFHLEGSGLEEVNFICGNAAGDFCIGGSFFSTVDFDPGPGQHLLTASGNFDHFLAKYDASGNLLWVFNAGPASGQNFDYSDGCMDANGDLWLTGSFIGTIDFDRGNLVFNLTCQSVNFVNAFVARYDQNGNFIHAFSFGGGASGSCHGYCIENNGALFLSGYVSNTVDFDPSAGVYNQSSVSLQDVFVASYTTAGGFNWVKTFGGSSADYGTNLCLGQNSDVYVSGRFAATVDFDGGPGVASHTAVPNSYDGFVVRYSTSGVFQWVLTFGDVGGEDVYDMDTDPNGNVYLSGSYAGTIDFDPGAGQFLVTSSTSRDIYVASYDANANFRWAMGITGSGSSDYGFGIAVHGIDDISITGGFSGTADFNPGPATDTLTWSGGKYDMYAARYTDFVKGIDEQQTAVLGLFPNPANEFLNVQLPSGETAAVYEVYAASGQLVLSNAVQDNLFRVNIEPLAEGVYFIVVRTETISFRQRFVKQ